MPTVNSTKHQRLPSARVECLRRSAYGRGVRFPEGMNYEDLALIPRMIGSCAKVAFAETKTYFYRLNPSSIISTAFPDDYKQWYPALDMTQNYIDENHPNLRKAIRVCYITRLIFLAYDVSPVKNKYPEAVKDILSRLHAKDLPGYVTSPEKWRYKITLAFLLLMPNLTLGLLGGLKRLRMRLRF